MATITKKYTLIDRSNAAKKLSAEYIGSDLRAAGLSEYQVSRLCAKLVGMVVAEKNGEYIVAYPLNVAEDLARKAAMLAEKIDETEGLETLVEPHQESTETVAEPDLEDAYQAIDAITLSGSEKQIKWAKDIALQHQQTIATAWKQKSFKLPTSAKWWIDNRADIYKGLMTL